jgi:hypothetical protein
LGYAGNCARGNIGVVTGVNSYLNSSIGEFGTDDDYDTFVRISPLIGIDGLSLNSGFLTLKNETVLLTQVPEYLS